MFSTKICRSVLLLFIGLLLLNLNTFVDGQLSKRCSTPNQVYGVCISLKECDPLVSLLRSSAGNPVAIKFLQQSQCGYVGSTPLVCCPGFQFEESGRQLSSSSSRPIVFPTSRTTTTSTLPPETEPVLKPKSSVIQLPAAPNCGFCNCSDSRIVGGSETKRGEFPWMAALGYRNNKNPKVPRWLCGGTLITTRHVLTAAHCGIEKDLYIVRLGEHDLYDDEDGMEPQDILVVNIKLHEGYSHSKYVNDIAIVTLERDADGKNIHPVCLPTTVNMRNRDFVNRQSTVAGWGSTYFRGPSTAKLMKVMLPIVSQDTCAAAFGKIANAVIDNRVICAGSPGSGKDSCKGDSGGPLMIPSNENHNDFTSPYYYLIGVVSYGIRCADPNYYGVYTKTASFLEWIQDNLKV